MQLIQGTPLLVLLFIVYFGLSIAGFNNLPALLAAGIAITLYHVGLSCRDLARVDPIDCQDTMGGRRMPWSFALAADDTRHSSQSLRIATPPTVGFLVQVIKNTSLASAIGFVELAQAGKLVNNSTFQPFSIFMVVAAIYFVICFPLTLASRKLERKLNVSNR